jgi:hypothetical protein
MLKQRKLIGLVGLIGSGKDTVASYLVSQLGFKQQSFAAPLKEASSAIFGWSISMLEGKTENSRIVRETEDTWWADKLNMPGFNPRKALQVLGTEVFRDSFHPDIWVLAAQKRISKTEDIVFSDVRFANEARMIVEEGGAIVRIKRGIDPDWWPEAKRAAAGNKAAIAYLEGFKIHSSEWSWANVQEDAAIYNDDTLETLYSDVESTLCKLYPQ